MTVVLLPQIVEAARPEALGQSRSSSKHYPIPALCVTIARDTQSPTAA